MAVGAVRTKNRHGMKCLVSLLCLPLCVAGCGDEPTLDDETAAQSLSYQMPPVELAAGEELNEWCQTWELDNSEPLYINRISVSADQHWHHSNWYAISADRLDPPPEDFWNCFDHNADTFALHQDGRLLFAQTVGVVDDEIDLPDGVALPIPAHAILVANIHVINVTAEPVSTAISIEVDTIVKSDVTATLNAFEIAYLGLDIPPMARSEFSADCDYDLVHQQRLGRPLDFKIHYLMPHYHATGERLLMEMMGGPEDGRTLLDTQAYGEPAGQLFVPPIDFTGAKGYRFSCSYDNPTSDTLVWGGAEDEMCLIMGWLETELVWTGGTLGDNEVLGDTMGDGVIRNVADCFPFATEPEL
jgi:hypothetical protein